MSLKHMKSLIVLVVGLLSVGCGKTEPMGSGNEYNAELAIDQNTTKAEPVKELTPEQKQKALRDSVVGEYELKRGEDTLRMVLLGNGISEGYKNGKKDEVEHKWSISKEGEIHATDSDGDILVFRINTKSSRGISSVRSITNIAEIKEGKRTKLAKDEQLTIEKIK